MRAHSSPWFGTKGECAPPSLEGLLPGDLWGALLAASAPFDAAARAVHRRMWEARRVGRVRGSATGSFVPVRAVPSPDIAGEEALMAAVQAPLKIAEVELLRLRRRRYEEGVARYPPGRIEIDDGRCRPARVIGLVRPTPEVLP
jgi:hypothetical protein